MEARESKAFVLTPRQAEVLGIGASLGLMLVAAMGCEEKFKKAAINDTMMLAQMIILGEYKQFQKDRAEYHKLHEDVQRIVREIAEFAKGEKMSDDAFGLDFDKLFGDLGDTDFGSGPDFGPEN